MILSNIAIHQAIDEGALIIDPEPNRFSTLDNPASGYDTSAVDLTLANELSIPKRDKPFVFDLRGKKGLAGFLKEVCEHKTIDPEGGYSLGPNQFVLGRTREKISLPIREGQSVLAARVEGKSSRARCGLLVHFTAPTVHAGFEGTITLEMINLGAYPILLFPGMEICQLIIEQVAGTPSPAPSQFQSQSSAVGNRT